MAGFDLSNYVPVEERLSAFYEKHPDGSIQTEITHLSESVVIVKATAYRTPDDGRPSTGHSQMNIPGGTPYTKGSEVENAETSAVGRALAMMGFEVKRGMASRQEVANKAPLPPVDMPPWVDGFNKARKERGITAAEIAEVIGASGTVSNIEAWIAADPDNRTPGKILSLAADLKAVPA